MIIIDLTNILNEDTPVWPGDPKTEITPAGILERDGYQDHKITVGTHVGTHIDAPAHMIDDGNGLDKVPMEQFVGRGRLIKVENQTFSLDDVKQADIQARDIVLFCTGLSNKYHKPSYFEDFPSIPEDIAKYLVDKKVSMLGIDMSSPDHAPYKIHKLLLSNNVLIIENLTNLEKLVGQKFEVTALPLSLQLDGSPARVIARIQ